MESASSLAVETEILCEGLSNTELEAFRDEVPDCPCVIFKIAGSETLVCAVEEWEMLLCPYDFGDLFPLLTGRVDSGRIVSTGVQQNYTSFWCGLNC